MSNKITNQKGIMSGQGVVEQINSFRIGSESTNITSRTYGANNNLTTTPSISKNAAKLSLNLGFSNYSNKLNYFSSFDQGG